MIHIDTDSLTSFQVKLSSCERVNLFYKDNSTHFHDTEMLSPDYPFIYFNCNDNAVANSDFYFKFQKECKSIEGSPAYLEAELLIERYSKVMFMKSINDILDTLLNRLELTTNTAFGLVDAMPELCGTLYRKKTFYKHLAVMFLITGCFDKGLSAQYLSAKYKKLADQRYEYELTQN